MKLVEVGGVRVGGVVVGGKEWRKLFIHPGNREPRDLILSPYPHGKGTIFCESQGNRFAIGVVKYGA